MRSLPQLLREPRADEAAVARRRDPGPGGQSVLRWGELRRRVAGLRDRVLALPEGPWVLLTERADAFAVGLLALWQAGRHAISPPNAQREALLALGTRAAGVLCDRPDWFGGRACLDPLSAPEGDPESLVALDPDAAAVELFTSGTTGNEKPSGKRLRHLGDEVQELEALFGERVAGAEVFATASHQHLYGMLFGVLWPLCAGRVFQAEHLLHPGELMPRMLETPRALLAGVPTHLRRLARRADLGALREHCVAVFSSGGPLAAETAHALGAALGHPPLEVFGSTETGGIAWRSQEPRRGDAPWQPFPRVRVAADPRSGVARVASPFVSAVDAGGVFATSDRIELLEGGRFRLAGRTDRVVKVGEKRLELSQMESELRAHRCVADAALCTLERDGETRVAAVVVPTDEGWALLRREGRRALARTLASALAASWDPVLHPRAWRALPRLPESPQGKVRVEALRASLGARDLRTPRAERPELLEEIRGDDFVERRCCVPRDLPCLAGHFPDHPVVPGVLQLDWGLDLAAELTDGPVAVEEVETLKFRTALGPGDGFRLRARWIPDGRLEIRLWSAAGEHAHARVRLGPEWRAEP